MSGEESIRTWLEAVHLQDYVPVLISQGYDTLNKCATIRGKQALKDMGVTKVGHLNRLLRAIEKLQIEQNSATLPANATLNDWICEDKKSKSLTLIPSTLKQPPPVPARKSVHRSNSPSHLHSQASECNSKPLPPPVLPRSKSLGRTAISVSQDLVEGCAIPLPENSHSKRLLSDKLQTAMIFVPPTPTPRKHLPPSKLQVPLVTSSDSSTAAEVCLPIELPPVPLKKLASSKPPVGVVFELEDIPMPRQPTSGFKPVETCPSELPPRASSPSLFLSSSSPLEFLNSGKEMKLPLSDSGLWSFIPSLPMPSDCSRKESSNIYPLLPSEKQDQVTNLSFLDTHATDEIVGLSSLREIVNSSPVPSEPNTISSIDSGCPEAVHMTGKDDRLQISSNFSPKEQNLIAHKELKPPPLDFAVSTITPLPVEKATADVPPKRSLSPPPPPGTDSNYLVNYINDQCGTNREDEILSSIQSTQPTGNVSIGVQNDYNSSSGSSWDETSPIHAPIRQQLSGLKSGANAVESDCKMLITSPEICERDDYMNQQVIDKLFDDDEDEDEIRVGQPLTVKGTGGALLNDLEIQINNNHDYMNSCVVQQVLEEDDENEHLASERLTIRSTLSRQSQRDTDRDYENQEVVEGDIIPLVTVSPDQIDKSQSEVSAAAPLDVPCLKNSLPQSPADGGDSPFDSQAKNLGSNVSILPLSNTDSLSGTFPRTKNYSSYLREYSDGNSSISTTPGSVDSLSAESSHLSMGIEDSDGGHLIRTAGTFAGGDSYYQRPDYTRNQSNVNMSLPEVFSESIYATSTRHGSGSFQDVPKAREGYLFKKGGRRSERPWQKRWMTFNGLELKYFKNQFDKDKSFLNIVPLHEMIDIKKVQDVRDDKQHRFDLVVINRVFQFYAASADDSQAWIDVLHAAISKYKPQDHEFVEGGNMNNPDKQGFLLKQGHGTLNRGFRERFVALKGSKFAYYETKEDFNHGRPIHVLEMSLSSVRPDISSKLSRFIITMNNMKQYVFQAKDDIERKEWLDTMTTAILTGLDTRTQTIARGGHNTTSQDILSQVQENISNKLCADCTAVDPSWGVINKGIMICINCSGVHRSLGTHISKVRSVELDWQIWKSSLIKLMLEIGNANSNAFWEKHYNGKRLPHDVERDIREDFIRAKYEVKSWIPRPTGESQEALDKLLCECVTTNNLLKTIELLAHGAQACGSSNDTECSPLSIARQHNQEAQVELLEQNGGLICKLETSPQPVPASKRGNLFKTGSDRSGWRKRYCTLDKYKGFEYFKAEGDAESLGYINVDEMLSVSKCDDEGLRDPRYKHCFEVNTQGRGYLFCAENEEDMKDWIEIFENIIPGDAADNLGFDKVGYLRKKDHVGGFKRRWFTLKGKSLSSYRREREEIEEIDLRKVTDIRSPVSGGSYEQQCIFTVYMSDKVYQLRADNPNDAEMWVAALKHTQVSGLPLSEQQLTGTGIPILVHKCLQFVEMYGLETEGLYRLSGGKTNSRKLLLSFNQDARGVVIDAEQYTIHDVAGTLKQFFRNLPDPLLTHKLYQSFVNTMQSEHESQMYQLQSLIEELPPVNRETLRRIIGHLKRVADNERRNKMGLNNLVSLFAPTLMTVDGDPVLFENTQHEYTCIHAMIKHYKWLFQVDEEEAKKEEAIEAAMLKIKEAGKIQGQQSIISSSMDFLSRVYIGSKDGDSYGINITGTSLVSDVVERVVTDKALPPNRYALYLVLGDSESHRVLSFNERLLAVLCSTGSDCFLCLKPNAFGETLKQYIDYVKEAEPITLQVREKKKWKKYPCTVRNDCFIQFKDTKCHHEYFKLGVHELDVFAGIEGSKIDVKNPLPTRYCFWLKAMRGEDKYVCADTEEDMLKIIAWIIKAKYPDQLQTPLLPKIHPPVTQPPVLCVNQQSSPVIDRKEELRDYANLKITTKLSS